MVRSVCLSFLIRRLRLEAAEQCSLDFMNYGHPNSSVRWPPVTAGMGDGSEDSCSLSAVMAFSHPN